MKPSSRFVLLLSLTLPSFLGSPSANGSIIEIHTSPPARFESARPGILSGIQSLTMPIVVGSEVTVIHLGEYGPADVDQARILTRDSMLPGEWDAALSRIRNITDLNYSWVWYWFGLERADNPNQPQILYDAPRDSVGLYNLQQITVTPDDFLQWHDSGNTFHRATFRVQYHFLVPEPSTIGLMLLTGFACPRTRRPVPLANSREL
jgi:hypothetical protein